MVTVVQETPTGWGVKRKGGVLSEHPNARPHRPHELSGDTRQREQPEENHQPRSGNNRYGDRMETVRTPMESVWKPYGDRMRTVWDPYLDRVPGDRTGDRMPDRMETVRNRMGTV